ncbi:MAG: 3-phosphoglycerate dehydrogenase [Candidatus Cloacimonetes bacterium]|nr:3-phosphoglycerate dehydrogenase [Candidatus Cloacimonadota bacterium]
MSKKVLVATEKPFASEAVGKIKDFCVKAGYECIMLEKYADHADLVAAVKTVDALIVRSDKVTADVIENADNLKIVVRAGAGFDNLDLAAASAKGVVCMNTPGQNSNAVAELAIGMMVYLARNQFQPKAGTELMGKKVGIHAYGNVGRHVARIARGFNMEVFAFDPYVTDDALISEGITPVHSADELYSSCDYISLHLPKTEKTLKFVNRDLLRKMPKGAALINTARKEVVCQEGLKLVLGERADLKYASDIAPDNAAELIELFPAQVFFTPKKMGAQTQEANLNAGVAAISQIVKYLEEGDNTFQVNK